MSGLTVAMFTYPLSAKVSSRLLACVDSPEIIITAAVSSENFMLQKYEKNLKQADIPV